MSVAFDLWRAGLVRRWHTNPHLADTCDRTDGHSARVALLALAMRPSLSREAIIYALTHDAGEAYAGDMPRTVKSANPGLADALEEVEAVGRTRLDLTPASCVNERERAVIKVADMLDAWLWASHNRPSLQNRREWAEMAEEILDLATEAGGLDVVLGIMRAARVSP